MVSIDIVRKLALSLPETTEEAHFEKTSFRVKKKIFATYNDKSNELTLKFSSQNQDLFIVAGNSSIYPVPNKWGEQGWTLVNLNKVKQEVLEEALKIAFLEVAPKKLHEHVNLK